MSEHGTGTEDAVGEASVVGPLRGVRVVELGSIGPGPHAAMLLGDLGADVVRVERPSSARDRPADATLRSRRITELDARDPRDRERLRDLVAAADVLIDPYRPGAAERMGIGPHDALAANPRLVYGRLTGWGQAGPLAPTAGHDINFLAASGALAGFGRPGEAPRAPMNLVGDYGGGSLYLVLGVLAALWERERSGRGQVVDAAMIDGVTSLMQLTWQLRGAGRWGEPGTNLLDGGAPFYDTYACSDGGHVAVGAIEPPFFTELVTRLGWEDVDDVVAAQNDRAQWATLRARLAATFAAQPRDHWAQVFAGSDACVTPVLSLTEAVDHPHARERGTHVEIDGVAQAAIVPRLSRTPGPSLRAPSPQPVDVSTVLDRWRAGR